MSEMIFSFVATTSDGIKWDELRMLGGEKTPWQQLRSHCELHGVVIRKLSAILGPSRRISSESAAAYAMVYRVNVSITTGEQSTLRGFGTLQDGDDKFGMVWVSDDGEITGGESSVSDMAVHMIPGSGSYQNK